MDHGQFSRLAFVDNKAKGESQRGRFKKKHVKIFGKCGMLYFLKHPFWDSPFCLITAVLSEFERINELLFPLKSLENRTFSDDYRWDKK